MSRDLTRRGKWVWELAYDPAGHRVWLGPSWWSVTLLVQEATCEQRAYLQSMVGDWEKLPQILVHPIDDAL